MMGKLQDEEKPIDEEIAREIIAAAPESWRSVTLEVTHATSPEGVERYAHVISSPEGGKEYVQPTDELYSATRRLGLLFRKHGHHWKKVRYTVHLEEDDSLRYTVEFVY